MWVRDEEDLEIRNNETWIISIMTKLSNNKEDEEEAVL